MIMVAGDSIDKHISILGILYIALSAIFLFVAVLVFAIIAGAGVISGDQDAMIVTGTVGILLAVFFLILSLPGLVTGYGLIRHRPWSRVLGIILAILNLLNFPLGTILGIYALWVLFNPDAQRILSPMQARQ
jgi:hypothetical protein